MQYFYDPRVGVMVDEDGLGPAPGGGYGCARFGPPVLSVKEAQALWKWALHAKAEIA